MIRTALLESLEGRQLFASSGLMAQMPRPSDGEQASVLPRFPKVDESIDAAKPVAVYAGKITTDEGEPRRFALAIVSETDGNVVARIPGREGGIKLTGTLAGDTYTLAASKEGRSVSVVATVDVDGNVTGTITHTFTTRSGETESHVATLALKKVTAPTGTEPPVTSPPVVDRPVRPYRPDRHQISNVTVYTGTISGSDKTGDVFIQTFTNREGKTMILIAAKHRFGLRPAILEATIEGNTITASKSAGDRSIAIAFTTSNDGSLTGTVTLAKGDATRVLNVDADKKTLQLETT